MSKINNITIEQGNLFLTPAIFLAIVIQGDCQMTDLRCAVKTLILLRGLGSVGLKFYLAKWLW